MTSRKDGRRACAGIATAVVLLGVQLCGCAGRGIVVPAAASLKNVLTDFRGVFTAKTGIPVRFNFGASGVLQKQIEAGAPVDVSVSAGTKQMDELQSRGLLDPGTRADVARTELVLVIRDRTSARSGSPQS